MRISHFFIDRPIFASVLSIVFIILGGVSFIRLPIAQYPEIVPPIINVSGQYPGANAEVVATTVVAPIEEQINGVENMLYMSSNATADGRFSIAVTFDIGDLGWTANRDRAEVLGLLRDAAPRGSVFFLRVREVIKNPCVQGGEGAQTNPAATALMAQVEALPHLVLANKQPVQVGGYAGQQVDVTVADGVLAACGGLAGAEAAIFAAGEEVWSASSGERFRLVAIDIGGQAVTVLRGELLDGGAEA